MSTTVSSLVLLFAVVLVTTASALRTTDVQDVCAGALTATVTFQTSCTTIDVGDASCWTPHTPGASDVVLFPSGTAASMPFAPSYTPIYASSVVIASGASVTLNGGAIVVTQCLQVAGSLSLNQLVTDNGTTSTIAFPADASVPHGTDCPAVPQGFSPRLCGPGETYVTGSLSLTGLYASLWITTIVASGASITFDQEAFLWGNLTNYGTLSSNTALFYHGELTNGAGGTASFVQVRPDFWTKTPAAVTVTLNMINLGTMSFTDPHKQAQYGTVFEFMATKDLVRNYNTINWVVLNLVNHANLAINGPARAQYYKTVSYWIAAVNLDNYGTTTWTGYQSFQGSGSATNYGVFIANTAYVWYTNYVSHGGTLQTQNGGSFGMGMSAESEMALKNKGLRGPFMHSVVLINTVIAGDVVLHAPIEVHGKLEVLPGASVTNEITYATAPFTAKSNGVLHVGGKYVAGKLESSLPPMVVSRTGSIAIPEGCATTLLSNVPVVTADGAIIHVEGTLNTVTDSNGGASLVQISPRTFVTGEGVVAGDFALGAVRM